MNTGLDNGDAVGFADLPERFAVHGARAVEYQLERVVEHARRHRVTPVLVAILADPAQPEIARQRAFGRITTELDDATQSRHPSIPVTDAA